MKILIVAGNPTLREVIEEHSADLYAASGEGDIVVVESNAAGDEHWPDAEVAYGIIDRPSFLKAKKLRWFHTAGAGVDRMMFPEFIESDVVLTSEKGLVGDYLADHAAAFSLCEVDSLTRAEMQRLRPSSRTPADPAPRSCRARGGSLLRRCR